MEKTSLNLSHALTDFHHMYGWSTNYKRTGHDETSMT